MTPKPLYLTIEQIKTALNGPRPGLRGQATMSPMGRMAPELYRLGSLDCRRAAVLFLLYPYQGELYTLLTVRPDTMPSHPGQVSFPGGSKDESESVEETALREAQEEVGLDPTTVETLGRLTHIYIPPSHFCIQVLLAYTPERPTWHPNPDEVAEMMEIPLAMIFDRDFWRTTTRKHLGERREIPYMKLGNHRVWGATAMILSEFVALIEESTANS